MESSKVRCNIVNQNVWQHHFEVYLKNVIPEMRCEHGTIMLASGTSGGRHSTCMTPSMDTYLHKCSETLASWYLGTSGERGVQTYISHAGVSTRRWKYGFGQTPDAWLLEP